MKIPEAQKMYRAYRQDLIDHQKELLKQRDYAKKQFEMTGDSAFSDQAATLQLSVEATSKAFEDNQKILDQLTEQAAAVWNAEVAKQQADPVDGIAASMSKIMTTVMRMCKGDKVPYGDEKKLMEFNSDMYKMAKNAQMVMQQMRKKVDEHDSVWDEEGGEYDPEQRVAETEAAGDLPDIPELEDISMSESEAVSE